MSIVGRLPSTNSFAGRVLPEILDGGFLWRCPACKLAFRSPGIDKSRLDSLYATGMESLWSGEPEQRKDWKIACRWLRHYLPKGSSILDIGCFDGGFLNLMGDGYRRFGVEVHPQAAQRAIGRGIRIVGEDFAALCQFEGSVSAVTVFDVIEHVKAPREFLTRCRDLLGGEGYIIVATGNIDALAFRFMGAAYWYSSLAEHMSFIGRRWLDKVAGELGLVIEEQAVFSHGTHRIRRYVPELMANVGYRLAPGLFTWLRRHGWGERDVTSHPILAAYPPGWMAARDHFITLLKLQ